MNKQEIKKRLNSDEDRCKYCNYSTISAGDIYCNKGFSQGMNCEGENFVVDFNIGVIISSHQLTNGWIPVSERLPTKEEFNKNDGRFIVTDGMRRYQSLFDIYEGKYFVDITHLGNCNFKETVDNCVVAWQPLPEKYTEESE